MNLSLPRRTVALGLLAGSLALAGCGKDDSSSGSSSSGGSGSANASTQCPPADGSAQKKQSFDDAPPMCIDANKTYTATMTTDVGDVVITLDAKKAPKTVNNFVVLSRYHFYDGVSFHRVIPGFMAQGGDPKGDGTGGPGYTIEDEFPQQGEYKEGSIAMANTGQPNSGGSQFFIVTGDSGTALPPQYTLFGQVSKGMDVVKKIEADGNQDGSQEGTPMKKHTITSVKIEEK